MTVGELVAILSQVDQERSVTVWDFTTGVPMRPAIREGNPWDSDHVTIWPSDVSADGSVRTDPRGIDPTVALNDGGA